MQGSHSELGLPVTEARIEPSLGYLPPDSSTQATFFSSLEKSRGFRSGLNLVKKARICKARD